jgi:hypothetical protein
VAVIGNPTYGQLLIAHDERATLWTAETTATSSGTQAGRLLSLTSALALGCAGTPTFADGSTVRCQRPGYPDGGASVSYVDAGSRYIGWDAPTSVQYVEEVDWVSGKTAGIDAAGNAAVTGAEQVVLVTEDQSAAGQSAIRVRVRTTAGVWSSALTLLTDTDAASGARMWPQVVAADGRVRIYMWRRIVEDKGAFLSVWEADEDDDLTSAASWKEVAWDGYQVLTTTDEPDSLRVTFGGGQWMAVYLLDSTIYQLASRDGVRWQSAGSVAESGMANTTQALMFTGGAFVLGYVVAPGGGDVKVKSRAVGSAYTALSTASAVTVYDPTASTGLKLASYVDDAGRGWLVTGGSEYSQGMQWATSDGGATWRGDGGSNGDGRRLGTSKSAALLTTITDPAPVWWRDRALLIHRTSTDITGSMDDALVCLHLGGASSFPLPESTMGWEPERRFAWLASWWPSLRIDNTWETVTGVVTRAPDPSVDGVAYVVTTDAAESLSLSPGTGTFGEVGGRWVGQTVSGTVDHQLQATDGTDAVRVRITQTSAGFTVHDDIAGGAALHTVANTGIIDIQAWVRRDTASYLIAYGAWTGGVRTYTTLTGSGLTTAASAASQYATTVNDSTVHRYYFLGTSSAAANDEARDIGRGVVRDWSTPGRVPGRPIGGRAVYLADGLRVYGAGGYARAGETWTYTADAQYHVRQAEWTPTYPSPRTRWLSTVNTTEAVAYKLGDDAVSTLSPVWGLVYEGTAQRLALAFHDGSTWGSDTTIDLGAEWEFTRTGSTLTPTGTAEVGPYVQEDELVGGFAVDPAGRARRIASNTAGVLGSVTGLTWQKARITLTLTGSESSGTNDWRIFWPRASYIFAPPATAKGFRVRFGASSSYRDLPESVHGAKLLIGPAYYLGLKHGQDSTRQYDTPTRTASGESGLRYTGRAAPSTQTVTLTWQSTLDRLAQARGTYAGGPDYEAAWSGGDPAYTRGGMESTLRGLVERWSATGTPVAYIPSYTRSAAEKHLAQRAGGLIVGTLDPTWTVEHVGRQDEQRTDVVRLGALTITALT